MKDYLVYDDGKVPSIFFPAGETSKGGSCDFSTRKCREVCPSNMYAPDIIHRVFELFKTLPICELVVNIKNELLERKKSHLQWFPTGDCPKDLTWKIMDVMQELAQSFKITQCCFTRNEELWDHGNWRAEEDEYPVPCRIILTVENKDDLLEACHKYGLGIVAIPDYKIGWVKLYKGVKYINDKTVLEKEYGTCGGSFMVERTYKKSIPVRTHVADCIECAKFKRGCFTEESNESN